MTLWSSRLFNLKLTDFYVSKEHSKKEYVKQELTRHIVNGHEELMIDLLRNKVINSIF